MSMMAWFALDTLEWMRLGVLISLSFVHQAFLCSDRRDLGWEGGFVVVYHKGRVSQVKTYGSTGSGSFAASASSF